MKCDCGAYEIELPENFNIVEFNHDSEFGNNELWLVKVEMKDNFYRYRGVKLPDYESVILDIDMDHKVAYSPCNFVLVKEIHRILKGGNIYKDCELIKK